MGFGMTVSLNAIYIVPARKAGFIGNTIPDKPDRRL